MPFPILILGGTAEAHALAEALAADSDLTVTTALAGRTAAPRLPPGRVVQGGFGGAAGLAAFLRSERVAAVIDATHPFAARMGANADQAARLTATPLLRLERPAWTPEPADRWDAVDDWDQAAQALAARASRVLLAIGRHELDPFVGLDHLWFLIRSVERPEPFPPFRQAEFTAARGPFTVDLEAMLLRHHAIDAIVCKNSGGTASMAKLIAARDLGIRVVMRNRPSRPAADTVATIGEVLDWVTRVRSPGR